MKPFGCPHRRDFIKAVLGVISLSSASVGTRAASNALPLIVLDPGHGGHDPGAIGVTGLYEKHVALKTAQSLKLALKKGGRCRVMLTREDDTFVPLDQRITTAQQHGAHLFVSMHADALSDPNTRGASVYSLSLKASDAQTDELARRENSVDPAAMEDYKAYSPEVASILASLAARETHYFSGRLQDDLVAAFSRDVRLLRNPARRANFAVLRSSEMPSVLVEMGFMSNRADERLLQSDRHQAKIVAALKTGIETCISQTMIR
ncbi:N-acetylmuramoyl-L-alanine amidase family protein (plasmid) [Nitrobacteraceae bacterium UC4446_H13]